MTYGRFYPSLYFVGKTAKFSDAATQTLTGLRRGTLNQRQLVSIIIFLFLLIYVFCLLNSFVLRLFLTILLLCILKLGSAVWHMWARKRCFLAENRVFWGSGGVKNEPDLLRKKVPPFLGSNV